MLTSDDKSNLQLSFRSAGSKRLVFILMSPASGLRIPSTPPLSNFISVDAAIVEHLIRTGRLFNTKRGREQGTRVFLLFPRLTLQLGCIAASAR